MLDDTKTKWTLKALSEVVDLNPRLDKSGYRDDLEVSFVPMAAVEAGSGRMEVSLTKHFSTVKKGYTPFQEGDVLFAKITPCMENGKMAVVPKLTNGVGFGSTEFHVLRPRPSIEPRYVYHFVSNMSFRREAAHHMTGAVGQKRVPTSFLEAATIPVPPFDQQERIVAEIEKQFSRLDEAVANLKRVKANLKRYKAAVLKAAVEGKLTEDWRKQHPDVEPASKLLERILAERREKWKGKGKYKQPSEPDVNNVPLLPKEWIWTSLDQLSSHITSGSRDWSQFYGRGTGTFVLAQNVRPMRLDFTDRQRVDPPRGDSETERTRLQANDLLVTIVGAKTGDACRVSTRVTDYFVCQSVALLRPLRCSCAKFIELYLASPENGQAQWKRYMYGQGRPHLSFEQLKMTAVPLPSLDEQEQIIAEVERRLSVMNELESSIEANLTRADQLRQSFLQQAFTGTLPLTGELQVNERTVYESRR